MEFLSDLPEEEREKLLVLAYDDMCHLKVMQCCCHTPTHTHEHTQAHTQAHADTFAHT